MKNLIRRIMGRISAPRAVPDAAAGPLPGVGQGAMTCLETGMRRTVLHRHIRLTLGMTPDQYRAKWGLPADYPMVSDAYRARRDAVRRTRDPA